MLFDPPVQPRTSKHEPERLYDAVLYLRRGGHRVYRHGRDMHTLDGERVSTQSLLSLAETLRCRPLS